MKLLGFDEAESGGSLGGGKAICKLTPEVTGEVAVRQWLTWGERQGKFLREVGSIVLGVLIALGIGEIADAARWHARVDTSLSSIKTELAGNRFNLVERRLIEPCIAQRLAAIGKVLAEARRTHRLPLIESISTPGSRPVETAAFEVAKSEGVPLHLPHDTARDLALAYFLTATQYGQQTEAERGAWTMLRLIEHAEGPIDEGLLGILLQAWIQAESQAGWISLTARQGDDLLARNDVPVEYGAIGSRAALVEFWRGTKLCRPLLVDGKPYRVADPR